MWELHRQPDRCPRLAWRALMAPLWTRAIPQPCLFDQTQYVNSPQDVCGIRHRGCHSETCWTDEGEGVVELCWNMRGAPGRVQEQRRQFDVCAGDNHHGVGQSSSAGHYLRGGWRVRGEADPWLRGCTTMLRPACLPVMDRGSVLLDHLNCAKDRLLQSRGL